MKFILDKKEKYTVFSVLEAKLNSIVAPDLKTELVILNNEGIRNIILDLGEVNFIDSSGLSAILVGNRLCKDSGGKLIVSCITPNVNRLIKISQLDSVLSIVPTIQESRDYIMMSELARELKTEGVAEDASTEQAEE